MVSYVGVSTMGISAVYVKYTAEFTARGEFDKANSLLSTGFFVSGVVSAALFGLLALKLHAVLIWLKVPIPLMHDAQITILIVIGVFLGGLAFVVFGQALAGAHKIAETQGVWVVSYVAEMLLIFYLVGTGHGLIGLAEAFLFRGLISIVLNIFVAFKKLPWLRISPWRCSKESLRKLTGFGLAVQLNSLLSIALNTVERVIAAPLIGLTAVGQMDLSDKWPTCTSAIADAFAYSFLPAASYLKGGNNGKHLDSEREVARLYLRGARYMHLASSSLCAFLAAGSGPLLAAWLGTAHPASALLMTIFALQQNIHHMTGPGTSILKGIGRPKEELYYIIPNILAVAAFIPLPRLLFGHWSMIGLGASVVAGTVVSAVFFIFHANRGLGVAWRDYLRNVVVPGMVPYLVAAAFALPVWRMADHATRWHAAAVVAAMAAGYGLALAVAVDRLVLSSHERSWFRSIIQRESRQIFGTFRLFGESHERAI